MPTNAALFLFLAAAVIAVFAFFSIVAWVSTPARERQARDRLALLKTLAEHPGEHARQVLDLLREEDEARARKKEREEQRGWIAGGLIVIAVGVGLGVMLGILGDRGDWTVALIPFLIGCVLLGVGALFPKAGQIRKEVK
jgi:F0F1-type ATP synthase assembly protein I